MENLPIYISVVFILTTILTLYLFYLVLANASNSNTRDKSKLIIGTLSIWLLVQAFISIQGFYHAQTNKLPPRIFILAILPNILAIFLLFLTKLGRGFIDSLPLKQLTYLHLVRIPVELVLWWLFLSGVIPEMMTFEGRNFDILAGISAPFIAYYGFVKPKLANKSLIFWNIVCVGLLINIASMGFLSAPSPLQKLAFDQPNIAILYFPFSYLVSFIVPMVLLSHLTALRQLLLKK